MSKKTLPRIVYRLREIENNQNINKKVSYIINTQTHIRGGEHSGPAGHAFQDMAFSRAPDRTRLWQKKLLWLKGS